MITPASLDERGVTMVELIVGMAVGVLVSLMTVYVFVTTFTTQAAVTSTNLSGAQGQAVSDVIGRSVRTAVALRVVSPSQVDMQTSDGRCQGFAVVAGSMRVASAPIASAPAFASASPSSWPVLASPVASAGTSSYFASGTPSGVPYALSYAMVLPGAGGPRSGTLINGVSVPRTSPGSSSSCFP